MEYLEFYHESAPRPGKKTIVVHVMSKQHGFKLGEIRWQGAWRQYALFPEPDTVWNPTCLNDVNTEIHRLMQERWKAMNAARQDR